MDEFTLVHRYFSTQTCRRDDVRLGIGDDAAVVTPHPGYELVVTTDVLIDGVHFPSSTPPAALGHKALAVNISDIAAMGAEPAWATLSLALPVSDERWLTEFSAGFLEFADRFGVALIGGDTVRGPLAIGVQLIGQTPAGSALRRDGARPGDRVYVTGTLGDAGLGLRECVGESSIDGDDRAYLIDRLQRPLPRVDVGRALRGIASAAIDISDGLAADLGHILECSGYGADVDLARLPLSDAYRRCDPGWDPAVSGGDDYELCFTVAPERDAALQTATHELAVPITMIGAISDQPGLRLRDDSGQDYESAHDGFRHFQD